MIPKGFWKKTKCSKPPTRNGWLRIKWAKQKQIGNLQLRWPILANDSGYTATSVKQCHKPPIISFMVYTTHLSPFLEKWSSYIRNCMVNPGASHPRNYQFMGGLNIMYIHLLLVPLIYYFLALATFIY